MSTTAIKINNISKSFGDIRAVDGVSLEVEEGDLFGILGPDGAGKTTLFRMLATLLLPDSGDASVDGFDIVKDFKEIRRNIGYMPGRFSLYKDLSVEENINFFASIFGVNREEGYKLIEPIYCQLAPFRKRRAGALSGGMKQKLALCCALIHRPKVLFLDEPTTGVDAVSRQEFWDYLETLRKSGVTIVVSTSYMDEATRCRRIALMNNGKILDVETPQRLMDKYGLDSIESVFIHLMNGRDDMSELMQVPTPSDEKAIVVKDLTKRFGNFTAVDSVSFDVERGEIFGFLGANGAGKTTTIKMLSGLSFPTSGEARVAGFDVAAQAEEVKHNIGYMSQLFSLYDDLSVWDNIEFFGGIYGMASKDIKARGTMLLEELNFYERRNEKVGSLPLGWKQKVAFTVALLHDPKIVFLDEPTGGVDPAMRRQFWELIYNAAKKGVTIFVTTHYMDEAEYCNRVSIMVAGRIQALDTPENLKKTYDAQTMEQVFYKVAREGEKS